MLNVQADVRARLVAALGVAVRAGQAPDGSAEDQFPAELVLVRRSGGRRLDALRDRPRSEEHTSELQSHSDLVCRLLLEKKFF